MQNAGQNKFQRTKAENGIAIALAGQKSDLEGRREVSQEEAEQWARQNDLPFLETSAKNDFNVEKIFSKLAVDIYKRLHDGRLVSLTPKGYSGIQTKGRMLLRI